MLRIITISALLSIALCLVETEFDFGGSDEERIVSQLREQEFTEEEIQQLLQVSYFTKLL